MQRELKRLSGVRVTLWRPHDKRRGFRRTPGNDPSQNSRLYYCNFFVLRPVQYIHVHTYITYILSMYYIIYTFFASG